MKGALFEWLRTRLERHSRGKCSNDILATLIMTFLIMILIIMTINIDEINYNDITYFFSFYLLLFAKSFISQIS
jgi:hypothetical protein